MNNHADDTTRNDPAWLVGTRGRRQLPPLESACLVLVDLQRFFTEPGAPRFLPDWPACIPRIRMLIDAFRARGLPVIATRHSHPPGDDGGTMGLFFDELLLDSDPWTAMDPAAGIPADVAVVGKRRFSVLSAPGIEALVRKCGTLVLAGVQTHRCIMASAMDAARLGVRPVVVADACAAGSTGDHEAALKVLSGGHSHVALSGEVIDALEAGRDVAVMPRCRPAVGSVEAMNVDLLVVGLGPAGVSCALQAARDGLAVAAVGDEAPGGLLPAARRIDNLPGYPGGIGGVALAGRLADQVLVAGFPCIEDRVLFVDRLPDGGFLARCRSGLEVRSRAVCLATGTRPAPLPWGGGVSPGILRDVRGLPGDLHGRCVVVVGGGEAALDSALSAADRGADVQVLIRGTGAAACPGLLVEFQARGLSLRTGFPVEGIESVPGDGTIRVHGPAGEVRGHHVLACIGREPMLELAGALVGPDPGMGRVSTSSPGVFLAGDVIRGRDRYVATAMGDGQQAAMAAARWLADSRGKS